jgi:hypothetical protein
MENRQLERRNNNHPARRSLWQSIDAALARMCPATEPKPRSSPAPCFRGPASNAVLVVGGVCMCAVFDLPFLDRFERRAGFYVPVESCRIDDGANCESFGAGAEIGLALKPDEIRGAWMRCPWCGDNGNMRYHCAYCGGVICGGKVRGRMFYCRASCGAAWRVGHPVREIAVTEERSRHEWQSPSRRGSVSQAPAIQTDSARALLPPARRK